MAGDLKRKKCSLYLGEVTLFPLAGGLELGFRLGGSAYVYLPRRSRLRKVGFYGEGI